VSNAPIKKRNRAQRADPDAPTDDQVVLLGRRVEAARRARGLKQAELADRAGVNQASVSRLARGKPVTTPMLAKIVQGLGADLLVVLREDAP
jgi:transcriptional regulator with XRE-family HTH domain